MQSKDRVSLGKIGITLDSVWYEPYNASGTDDIKAAETLLQFTVSVSIITYLKLQNLKHLIDNEQGDYINCHANGSKCFSTTIGTISPNT